MKKVLILDDEQEIVEILSTMLENLPIEILKANNGLKGMKIIEKEHIHLLITDMHMPEQNGLDTLLEAKHFFPGLKIIGVSGDRKLLDKARYFGLDVCLTKPIARDDLVKYVNELLGLDTSHDTA